MKSGQNPPWQACAGDSPQTVLQTARSLEDVSASKRPNGTFLAPEGSRTSSESPTPHICKRYAPKICHAMGGGPDGIANPYLVGISAPKKKN